MKEQRTKMGIVGTELAYLEAIDRELQGRRFINTYSAATSYGYFYPTSRYKWLSKQLNRYREITKSQAAKWN